MTDGQRKLLEKALEGPVTVSSDHDKRVAEILGFKKWAVVEGNYRTALTVKTTDLGKKMLEHPDMVHVQRRNVKVPKDL